MAWMPVADLDATAVSLTESSGWTRLGLQAGRAQVGSTGSTEATAVDEAFATNTTWNVMPKLSRLRNSVHGAARPAPGLAPRRSRDRGRQSNARRKPRPALFRVEQSLGPIETIAQSVAERLVRSSAFDVLRDRRADDFRDWLTVNHCDGLKLFSLVGG